MAITQYLIIGLVTSRDRALDVLSEFDRAVAKRRNELIEEFKLEGNLPADFDPNAPIASTKKTSGNSPAEKPNESVAEPPASPDPPPQK
jgi:hypothetical protein